MVRLCTHNDVPDGIEEVDLTASRAVLLEHRLEPLLQLDAVPLDRCFDRARLHVAVVRCKDLLIPYGREGQAVVLPDQYRQRSSSRMGRTMPKMTLCICFLNQKKSLPE